VENLSKHQPDSGRPELPPDYVARMREDWRVARAAHSDLELMGMPRVNILLVGAPGPVQGVLELLEKTCASPIATWRPGERLALPPIGRARTFIIHDVCSLSFDDQCALAAWLERADGHMQVISTSAASPLPRVHSGEFLDTLYYRLNMVFVDLTN
jgi:hypothetical protein